MNQFIFNATVFLCAWAEKNRGVLGSAADDTIDQMFRGYAASYSEDNLREEVTQAIEILDSWLADVTLTEQERVAWYSTFMQVSTEWMPNGERKKRRIFNGVRFTSPRVKPNDRVQTFTKDLVLYFVNISAGRIKPK